jgi:hypothetical protein
VNRRMKPFNNDHLPAVLFVLLVLFGHLPPFQMVNDSGKFAVWATVGCACACVVCTHWPYTAGCSPCSQRSSVGKLCMSRFFSRVTGVYSA